MKLRRPGLWIAAFSGTAVLLVALSDVERESPGPLSVVHGQEPELAGGPSCSACHGGWFETMAGACLDCHEAIGAQMDGGTGLHGAIGAERAERCAFCHSEHHGADFAIVNAQSFAQAGTAADAFDHGLVGFPMGGRHLELECRACHQNADLAVLPAGATRFLGLDRDCASCHEDVHDGRMGSVACAQCHGQSAFTELHSTGHERHLPLIGGHAGVGCRACHESRTPHSLEAHGAGRAPAARACPDCHESPHGAGFVEAVAARRPAEPRGSCAVCHANAHTTFRDGGLDVTAEQHALSGFALVPPHAQVACEQCHPAGAESFAARYPGRGQDHCQSCHESPHGRQFDDGPFAAGCIACHERAGFEPHAFDAEKHARTALPLTGRHLEAECEQCHAAPPDGTPTVFRGTPARCAACHRDAHLGFFEPKASELETGAHGACAHCHGTASFLELPPGGFDHGRWTGFAVLGAHAQAECEICHPRAAEPDGLGRRFGTVAEHFGRFEGCVTCHRDPHGGGFDGGGRPAAVEGRTGCERCHEQSSFRDFPRGFDHGRWTGFALDGAHAAAACSACHAPLAEADESGRTWSRARGKECGACHEDPHAKQFEVAGRTDCRRCHRSAVGFSVLAFRHNLDARFALGEAHAGVPCAECHETVRQGGAEVVRYRPLPRRCVDCHGEAQGPFRRGKEGKR